MALPEKIVNQMYRDVHVYLGTDLHVTLMQKLRDLKALADEVAASHPDPSVAAKARNLVRDIPAKERE